MALVVLAWLAFSWALRRRPFIHPHSRRSECEINLRELYLTQRSFREQHGRYSEQPLADGFWPEYGNRYLYLFSSRWRVAERFDGGTPLRLDPLANAVGPDPHRTRETSLSLRAKLPMSVEAELGVRGDCDAGTCGFTAACVANLDDDDTPDVWTISTEPTVDLNGDTIPPGVPAHRVTDRAD